MTLKTELEQLIHSIDIDKMHSEVWTEFDRATDIAVMGKVPVSIGHTAASQLCDSVIYLMEVISDFIEIVEKSE